MQAFHAARGCLLAGVKVFAISLAGMTVSLTARVQGISHKMNWFLAGEKDGPCESALRFRPG